MKNEAKGVTLIALVITLIVLTIISGVTFSMLKSGIVNQATEADKRKTASEELEAVEWASAQAIGDEKNKIGKITNKEEIREQLNNYIGEKSNADQEFAYEIYGEGESYNGIEVSSGTFVVYFTSSGNYYTIQSNGNVN